MKHLLNTIMLLLFSVALFASELDTTLKADIVVETSLGDIEIALYDDTPLHKANMIKLVKEGFYTDHLFHRVIQGFMIQGGDPHSVGAPQGQRLGNGGPGYRVPAEILPKYYHKKGVIAAARMGDSVNPDRESSGSQFYIVQGNVLTIEQLNFLQSRSQETFSAEKISDYTTLGGTPHLDGAYTVFGEVVKGMEVIDAIGAVETNSFDRPNSDIAFTIRLKGE